MSHFTTYDTRLAFCLLSAALLLGCGRAHDAGADLGTRDGGGAPTDPDLGPDPGPDLGHDAGVDLGLDAHVPLPPAAGCDDGNPCTIDIPEGSGCVHEPWPDGSLCQDGDLCTLGDRCVAGRCEPGAVQSGPVGVEGRLKSFGTIRGSALPLRDGRFVFLDSPSIGSDIVVTRIGDDIEVLNRSSLDDLTFFDHWELKAEALGGGLFAYLEDRIFEREIVVARVTVDDEIEELARVELPSDSGVLPSVRSLEASGDDLFLCLNSFLGGASVQRIDVGDPGAPRLAERVILGEPQCGTMAATGDGALLYVNTTGGMRYLETDRSPPAVRPVFFSNAAPLVHDGRLYLVADTEVRILDAATRAPVATVPGAFDGALPSDVGLWVEESRTVDGRTESVVALIDPFAPGGPARLDEVVVQRLDFIAASDRTNLIGQGDTLIHTFTKRVFRYDGAQLEERRHPALGSLYRVHGRGAVAASRSRYSAHRIDLSDPTQPAFTAGGSIGASPAIALEPVVGLPLWADIDRAAQDPSVIELAENRGSPVTVRVRLYSDEQRAVDVETFEVDGGPALLRMGGDLLYRLEPSTPGQVAARLERYGLHGDLGDEPALVDAWDLAPASPIDRGDRSLAMAFAVDPIARVAVVAIGVVRGFDDEEGVLFWIDLATGEVAETPLAKVPTGIAVHGDRAVYTDGLGLHSHTRAGGEVAFADGLLDQYVPHLLAFDGRSAYVGAYRGLVVVPFGATSDVDAAFIPTTSAATSVSPTDTALLVGSANEAVAIRPACE